MWLRENAGLPRKGRGMAWICAADRPLPVGGARKKYYAERKILSERWWWGEQKVLRGETGASGELTAGITIAPLWGHEKC